MAPCMDATRIGVYAVLQKLFKNKTRRIVGALALASTVAMLILFSLAGAFLIR